MMRWSDQARQIMFPPAVLLALVVLGCASGGGGELRRHDFDVRRHALADIPDAAADGALRRGEEIARSNDGAGDVACGVELVRQGLVREFTEGNGIINSKADFDNIIALPGYVKVVNQINWCGGFLSGIRGCAPVPGNSMVVVRMNEDLEGILWLHEFGHTKGNHHRGSDTAVMYYSLGLDRRRLNPQECDSLRQSTSPATAASVATSIGTPIPAQSGPPPNIVDFVRRTYFHGIPYELASQYPASVVPTLLELLDNGSDNAQYSSNIVMTLGMVGDDEVARRLVRFISESEGDFGDAVSDDIYLAKTSAVMALGYLANRRSDTALDYLIESLDPTIWTRREVSWGSPIHADTLARDLQLTQMAIMALALSGREPAGNALRGLQPRAVTTGSPEAAVQPVSDLLAEALTTHDEVDRDGLKGYYGNVGR